MTVILVQRLGYATTHRIQTMTSTGQVKGHIQTREIKKLHHQVSEPDNFDRNRGVTTEIELKKIKMIYFSSSV